MKGPEKDQSFSYAILVFAFAVFYTTVGFVAYHIMQVATHAIH